jgi:hypothetical protein
MGRRLLYQVPMAKGRARRDCMSNEAVQKSGDAVARLAEAVDERLQALPGNNRGGYVSSELPAIHRVLARIQAEGLADGSLFCDWGSGLGGVCGVAALNGFSPVGIEIQGELVDSARLLAADLGLPSIFARGTFLQPGDEDLAIAGGHTQLDFDSRAWDELELAPADCNVVFAYPWPDEEAFLEEVFIRHASPGTLLVTFHDSDYVLVQRKVADSKKLFTLAWM